MSHVQPKLISEQTVSRITILLPFVACLLAMLLVGGEYGYTSDFILLIVFYLISVLGITVGYHRLLTHKSFKTSPSIRQIGRAHV